MAFFIYGFNAFILGSDTLLDSRYSIPWLLITDRDRFEHSDQIKMKVFNSFKNHNNINTTSAFSVFRLE